ncbi:glycosyltransferase [Plantactinospora soyae]|uniref:Glycosyltransferase involved in cell wall biosynthesis n=1 Tax=Plantactinospora soyae TaxID=1544732 RepID=A0A927MDV3_9ACTN|nr:glycosyltransferase [Plantactinospora soyae]MBE1491291.1 glycosyltransferase involved in cell wall biosynthesis [Plantactinospora soyae]
MTEGRPGLRVAYILLRPPSYSETFISAEIRAVRSAGATVEVFVARPGGRRAELARVVRTVFRHPVRLFAQVRTLGATDLRRAVLAGSHAIALAEQVGSFAPDVVHAHFVNLPTSVAALVAKEVGRPATAIAHAADFLLDRNPVGLARRLGLLRHLFVISAATVRQLEARGVAMATIPHSIVRAAYDGELPDPAPRAPDGTVRLVTVARLVEKKGVGTGVDAVARLVAAGLDVQYDVYGDGPLRSSLERRAEENGVSAAVTFHGAVPHAVATEALAGADVAVLPCTRGADGDLDGIPVFLMEAASRQVPVVTTAVSGIPELVDDDGGWLVAPDDPAALADAVARVVRDRAEARRRAGTLATRLRTEFRPERQAERLLDTWHRLADPAGDRRRAADASATEARR